MLNIKNNLPVARISAMFMSSSLFIVQNAFAQGIESPIKFKSLEALIANIITAALGLTAVLAVGFIVYGGFLYITAAGDESQIKKGKEALIGAIIGIIVIGLAYAIVEFVLGAVGAGGGGSGAGGGIT